MAVDASIVVKWYKKGEEHEQQALRIREEILTAKLHAIAPEWIFLELVRALVKIDFPKEKIEQAYESLREAASLGLMDIVPMSRSLDKAKEIEIQLKLFASDAAYLATAITHRTDLITEDRHLLNKRVLNYAKEEGIRILALERSTETWHWH